MSTSTKSNSWSHPFPPSRSLPLLLSSDSWEWNRSSRRDFWIGTDLDGMQWLVKIRGGFRAARERAFSIIAQALGISCQSSTFVKLSSKCLPRHLNEYADPIHSAIIFLDEHPEGRCSDDCPIDGLNLKFNSSPYDVTLLPNLGITDAIDWARGEMLGMLCNQFEPPGALITRQHMFIQIDNELMFSKGEADLFECYWVSKAKGRLRQAGTTEAIRLCEQILSLPDAVFEEALRTPRGALRNAPWSLRREVMGVRGRAQSFLSRVCII